MKNYILLLFLFVTSITFAQKVTFMPCWPQQSQWAGYYIAQEKGFYKEEGLEVNIVHPTLNSTISTIDRLAAGEADIIVSQMPDAQIAYASGIKLVNILQTSQNSSLVFVSQRPIRSINDLDNKRIARWKVGFGYVADFIIRKYGLSVKWITYIQGVNLFVYGAVDAILCSAYHEYYTLMTSLGSVDPRCVIKASELGYSFPEEGLYVSDDYYKRNKGVVDKFVRASIKGWEYAREHEQEALDLSIKIAMNKNIPINYYTQKNMLKDVLKLQINSETKKVDYQPISKFQFDIINNNLIECGIISQRIPYNEIVK